MEKQQKSIKVKIVSLAVSILVCLLLVGVSVYAALAQSLEISNTITITSAGQTKVEVVASEYLNTGNTAVASAPTGSVSWSELVTKTSDEDQKSKAATPIVFNVEDNHNYYAYKFEFTNESTKVVYAHIAATTVDNTELTIYYGQTFDASMTALANNTALDADVELSATNGEGEFYIVVAANVDLAALTERDVADFDITITLDQTA